jgi:hypothetical protein
VIQYNSSIIHPSLRQRRGSCGPPMLRTAERQQQQGRVDSVFMGLLQWPAATALFASTHSRLKVQQLRGPGIALIPCMGPEPEGTQKSVSES